MLFLSLNFLINSNLFLSRVGILSYLPILIKGDVLSSDERNYVNSLPSDYKKKAELYLDIFRDIPELVKDYLTTLKQFGSEKAAKEVLSIPICSELTTEQKDYVCNSIKAFFNS